MDWAVKQNPADNALSAWGLSYHPTFYDPPHSLDPLTLQLHPNSKPLKWNKTCENHWSKKLLTGTPGIPRGPSFPVSPGGPLGPGGPGGPGGPACPWSPYNGEGNRPKVTKQDKRPRSSFQHNNSVLSNPHVHYGKNQNNQKCEACRQFACQQRANKYSCCVSWVDAIKIKAAQEPIHSALGNSVYVITVFRAGIKLLHNFIHDNTASVNSPCLIKWLHLHLDKCVHFFITYKFKHTVLFVKLYNHL